MSKRFSVEAVFKAVDKLTAPVTRMQNRMGKFTRSVSRSFSKLSRGADRLVSKIGKFGKAAGVALGSIALPASKAIMTGAKFEQTLVNAAAKFPGEIRKGTEAFQQLEAAARKTGSTTEFTASQSAEALNFLAMAGFNAENAIAALPGVVDLATAAQVDLATATDVASDSLGAFGLMTKDSAQLGLNLARVNDVIAKTTTTANTTVEAMFETIKDGAPVATAAGASLETFAALTGELANSGIKGSKAGTTLKNMFLSLAAPSNTASKLLKRLGVQTQTTDGDMRDIVDILDDLGGSLDGLGTAQRSGVLEGIFGKIPIAGVNILLDSGSERLREYRKQLEGAEGAASSMAGVMRDTLQGRLNSLNSAVEGVSLRLFSMNEGPLNDTVDGMIEWVRANEVMLAQNMTTNLVALVNVVSALADAFTAVGTAIGVTAGAIVIFSEDVSSFVDKAGGVVDRHIGRTPADFSSRAAGQLNDMFTSTLTAVGEFIKDPFRSSSESLGTGGDVTIGSNGVPISITGSNNTTSTERSEVIIKDETGRAEQNGKQSPNASVTLQQSGAF